jgi:hypothetical protein
VVSNMNGLFSIICIYIYTVAILAQVLLFKSPGESQRD